MSFSSCKVKANWSYPSAIMLGCNFLIAKYLSFLSPRRTSFAQPISCNFSTRSFSLLSLSRPLICFTVLSRATIATMCGFSKRFAISRACLKRSSWPAWRWSNVPNSIIICCFWSVIIGRGAWLRAIRVARIYRSGTKIFTSISAMKISTIVPIKHASSILCDLSSVASEILSEEIA